MGFPKIKAEFTQPMLLLRTERLPEGPDWLYELKLDGYRALAIKTGGRVQLLTDKIAQTRCPGRRRAGSGEGLGFR